MSFVADLLEPSLAQSHTSVAIPLYKRVVFIRLLNCSEFSSRLSKKPNPRRDHRDSVLSREQRAGRAVVAWLGLNQQVLQHAREAVADFAQFGCQFIDTAH